MLYKVAAALIAFLVALARCDVFGSRHDAIARNGARVGELRGIFIRAIRHIFNARLIATSAAVAAIAAATIHSFTLILRDLCYLMTRRESVRYHIAVGADCGAAFHAFECFSVQTTINQLHCQANALSACLLTCTALLMRQRF